MMKGFELYAKRKWFSPSSLVSFSRCPRKFFYSSGVRLQPRETPNYFVFGEAIHRAIPLAITEGVEPALRAFDLVWDETLADQKRNRGRATRMLDSVRNSVKDGFMRLLPAPENSLKIEDRISEWEIPVAIDIGLEIPLVARIDGWCEISDAKGKVWLVEYKTSSELSSRFMTGFEGSPQLLLYALCVEALTRKKIDGAIVIGLRVSPSRAETLVHPVTFKRHQLEDVLLWAQKTGAEMLACETSENFPKNLSACTPYPQFGQPGYQCDFAPLCHFTDDWTQLKDLFAIGAERPFELSELPKAEVLP